MNDFYFWPWCTLDNEKKKREIEGGGVLAEDSIKSERLCAHFSLDYPYRFTRLATRTGRKIF